MDIPPIQLHPPPSDMSTPSVNFQGLGRILLTFQKQGSKDDRLTITPDSQSTGYDVTFLQNTIYNNTTTYMTNGELLPYLHRLLRTMEFDTQGYECVQFDCPSFPTVLIEASNLVNYYYVLADQIKSLQQSWPAERSGSDYSSQRKMSGSYSGDGRLFLTLIKKDTKDDTLSITPENGGTSYYVRYDQNYLKNSTERVLHAHELVPYLQRFFTALASDMEPYDHIQVDFPLYPSVMLDQKKVYSYLPLLVEQIQSIDSWPSECSGKRRVNNLRREYDWDTLAY